MEKQTEYKKVNFNANSMLAKLLAAENISIVNGDYPTAAFDTKNRVLYLPTWKTDSKYVYDLLVSHEVGHARFTPPQGWHDAIQGVDGIPKSLLNIVEDIRIEKKIQKLFPGLINTFAQGYKVLHHELDLFGVKTRDLATLNFIDRINMHAKLSYLAPEIKFTSKEQPMVDKALAVETWADVLAVCKMLLQFMKDNPETYKDFEFGDGEGEGEGEPQEGLDQAEGEGEGEGQDGKDGEEVSAAGDGKDQGDDSDEKPEGLEDAEGPSGGQLGSHDAVDGTFYRSVTEENFRQNEHRMIEKGDKFFRGNIAREDIPVVEFEEQFKTRQVLNAAQNKMIDDAYAKFKKNYKTYINTLVREFELRKSALATKRVQIDKKGSIDVDKLHSYKYNEDIFRRVTPVQKGKNHGFFIVIDRSGSMSGTIDEVFKQVLILIEFCRRLNIPYVVYTFTTCSGYGSGRNSKGNERRNDDQINLDDLSLVEVINSNLNKVNHQNAHRYLVARAYKDSMKDNAIYNFAAGSRFDRMSGTPLIEATLSALVLQHYFKEENNIEKLHTMFLTDGCGSEVLYTGKRRSYDVNNAGKIILDVKGVGTYEFDRVSHKSFQHQMTELLGTESNAIGYFLNAHPDGNGGMYDYAYNMKTKKKKVTKGEYKTLIAESLDRNGFFSEEKVFGYDEYFLINEGYVMKREKKKEKTEANPMDQIRKVKKQRTIATQIAKVIA